MRDTNDKTLYLRHAEWKKDFNSVGET